MISLSTKREINKHNSNINKLSKMLKYKLKK